MKNALKALSKNPIARKEALEALQNMADGKLLPRNNRGPFKSSKTLDELKFTKVRMLIQKGKDGEPDRIIAIFMKKDVKKIERNIKNQY